jgi:hypothetical protein
MIKKIILFCSTLAITAASGLSLDENSALDFFKKGQERARAFDPAVADMYADSATISTRRVFADGTEKTLSMTGAKYKERLKALLPVARDRGDTSKYSNISVIIEGSRAKIKATRYSELKNYTDDEYFMVVEETSPGVLHVVEEHTMTVPDSQKR